MKRIDIERLIDDNTVALNQGQRAFIDKIVIAHDKFQFHGFILGDGLMEYVWKNDGRCILPGSGRYDIVSGHCFVEDDGKVSDKVMEARAEAYKEIEWMRDVVVNRSKSDSDVPDGCLPFDVEKAKDGWPVVTREGCSVEVIKTDLRGQFPIAAVIKRDDEDSIDSFTEGGTYYGDGSICCDDLFLKQNSVFANVYNTNGIITVGKCYPTEAEAKSEPAAKKNTYVKTLEITIG